MNTRRALLQNLLVASLVLAASPSRSAEPSEKEKEAQKLFLEGRDALARGEHEIACVKFRGSLVLFPVANTRANVAQCEEREGHLIEALKAWRELLPELPDGDPRLAAARERIAALDAKIPHLRLVLSADMPPDAKILVDGAVMDRALVSAPLQLSAGAHTVIVEAPGRREERLSVTLAEGERAERKLAPGPFAGPPQTASASASQAPIAPPPSTDGRRVAAFVSGGVGLAALVAAGITGGMIIADDGEIQKKCSEGAQPGNKVCTPEGLSLIQAGEPVRILNGVMWGVGLAGVGLGAILLLTGGKSGTRAATAAPLLSRDGGGLMFMGSF